MNLYFTIKKLSIIIFIFTLSVNMEVATAQATSKIKPTKELSELMGSLKKEHGLKSTTLLYDKDSKEYYIQMAKKSASSNILEYGVASSNGTIIIPIKYKSITLHKGNNSNTSYENSQLIISRGGKFEILKNRTMPYKFNTPYPAMFTCYDGSKYSIITEFGEIKRDNIKGYVGRFHGFWIYSDSKVQPAFNHLCLEADKDGSNFFSFNSSNIGLLSHRGDVIIEPLYNDIIIQALQLPETNELVVTCTYSQIKLGVKLFGGCMLTNLSNKVPVEYSDVTITPQGKWAVRRISSDPFLEYQETSTPANRYRDNGELFFEQENYEDAIKYYSEVGIDAPWAKFYSGMAFYKIGHHTIENANFVISNISNNSSKEAISYKMSNIIFDFNRTKSNLEMAKSLFDAYLQSDDTSFKEQAKSTIIATKLELAQIGAIELGFNEAANIYRYRIAEAERAQLAALEQKRQRQAAIWGAVFNAFGSALNSAVSQPTKSYSSGGSSYTPSNTSNSSSSSNSGSKAQPDQAHINKLKKNISDAQEQYQKSLQRGDPAYQRNALKNSLDSYIKTLDTYMNSFR